ncbi:MAG: LysR family transcriptional regulator [Coriobacteriales bacterium]|jgi:molybdate transport system regulatory protein|nr:LysR family transcriptional regulator [Coriobacteriales bacterium]
MDLDHIQVQPRLTLFSGRGSDKHSFGKGVADLLCGVRQSGSLNAAAKQIMMSYSKAWRIVNEAEEAMGCKLIDRDGARGSALTAEGARLLDAYLALDEFLSKAAQAKFEELMR